MMSSVEEHAVFDQIEPRKVRCAALVPYPQNLAVVRRGRAAFSAFGELAMVDVIIL